MPPLAFAVERAALATAVRWCRYLSECIRFVVKGTFTAGAPCLEKGLKTQGPIFLLILGTIGR